MIKIWINVTPQILKELVNTLVNCRGVFEVNVPKHTLFILDVCAFTLTEDKDGGMFRIQIKTENNTKDIYIAKANITDFTCHLNAQT